VGSRLWVEGGNTNLRLQIITFLSYVASEGNMTCIHFHQPACPYFSPTLSHSLSNQVI